MAEYPFTIREQQAMRQFGKAGFRYDAETKKELSFVSLDELKRAYFSRLSKRPALNVDFGDPAAISSIPGVELGGKSASSNLRAFDMGATTRGGSQHQGNRIFLKDVHMIETVLKALT